MAGRAGVPGNASAARRPPSYLLAVPDAVLEGAALTAFLARVAPFGCPPPPSLIRAYSLPDAPYPSILLKEHGDAPAGMGDAYRRFAALARLRWLAALQETGAAWFRPWRGRRGRTGGSSLSTSGPERWERQASPGRAWPMTIWGEGCCCWRTRISGTRGTP